MEYNIGDKVRFNNGRIVIITSYCNDKTIGDYWGRFDNEGRTGGVIFFKSQIESKILDIDGSNLEKLEEQYKKMGETIAQLKKEKEKENIIYVPDCIKIGTMFSGNLGILNNEGYCLSYSKNSYFVSYCEHHTKIETKLIKTTWGELSPGDICYEVCSLSNINDLMFYTIKLKDGSQQYWNGKDCVNEYGIQKHNIVYKVVLA